jgi:hypothetical protein
MRQNSAGGRLDRWNPKGWYNHSPEGVTSAHEFGGRLRAFWFLNPVVNLRFKKQYPGRTGSPTDETVKPGITVRPAHTALALAVSLQEKKPMPCRSLSGTYGTVSADEQKEMSGLDRSDIENCRFHSTNTYDHVFNLIDPLIRFRTSIRREARRSSQKSQPFLGDDANACF